MGLNSCLLLLKHLNKVFNFWLLALFQSVMDLVNTNTQIFLIALHQIRQKIDYEGEFCGIPNQYIILMQILPKMWPLAPFYHHLYDNLTKIIWFYGLYNAETNISRYIQYDK
jgi:hypothetical protein